jgi:K(+)-stimulated pyrophosphate-energized sodium pump
LRGGVNASRQGGPSLNILSGLVAGNFSAFWEGLVILVLMLIAYLVSQSGSILSLMPTSCAAAAPGIAFGLVAFGLLGMGPVTTPWTALARFRTTPSPSMNSP